MDSSAAQQGAKQTAALGMAAAGHASHPATAALHVQVAAAAVAAAQQQAAEQMQRQEVEVVVEAVAGPAGLLRTGSLQPAPSPTDLKVRSMDAGSGMPCMSAATGRLTLESSPMITHRPIPLPAHAT